jgi:hypothetical protein
VIKPEQKRPCLPTKCGTKIEGLEFKYQKSLLQVYVDFVQFCIHSSGSLDIICRHWAPVETILRALAPELNAAGNPVKNYVEVETRIQDVDTQAKKVHKWRGTGDPTETAKTLNFLCKIFSEQSFKFLILVRLHVVRHMVFVVEHFIIEPS